MARHLQVNDPASDVSFDDTALSTATSGAVTGNTVQDIIDNQLAYLVVVLSTIFSSLGSLSSADTTLQGEIDTLTSDLGAAVSDISTLSSTVSAINSDYLSSAGGTMTGILSIAASAADSVIDVHRASTSYSAWQKYRTNSSTKWFVGLTGADDNLKIQTFGGTNAATFNETTGKATLVDLKVNTGASGTFTTADSKTVTVTDGIITSIV